MGLEPVLDVWAGLALGPPGGHAPPPVTGDALKPYVDDVLAELEFCLGDQSTTNGALRAKYGHTDPFKLNYVEIGNEDNLNNGGPSYPGRFQMFHDAIKAKYPNLTLIASTSEPDFLPKPKPAGMWTDFHIYENASVMVNNFSYFDTWDRNFPVAVMEIACTRIENTDANFKWPIMRASVAEAVYMIGIERNSDVVKMASYAPWLDNLNAPNRYTVSLKIPCLAKARANVAIAQCYHVQSRPQWHYTQHYLLGSADVLHQPWRYYPARQSRRPF